jgi:hypothetical protein
VQSWSGCARLWAWYHGAYLYEAKARGSELVEPVAIGVEARSYANRVTEVDAEDLALEIFASWCVT